MPIFATSSKLYAHWHCDMSFFFYLKYSQTNSGHPTVYHASQVLTVCTIHFITLSAGTYSNWFSSRETCL